MKISKTQFMNFMRCDRFAPLNEIYYKKDKAVVSITDNVEEEDLRSFENQSFKSAIVNSMFHNDSDDEENEEEINEHLEMMMPYYNKLEILSGDAIKNKFQGNVIYDLDTYNQKSFSYLKEGYSFYCFLDGYQEDDSNIRIFETKATTSSKFSEENFKYTYNKDGEKLTESFFVKLPSGVYVPREDLEIVPDKYYNQEKKLTDRYNDLGKYVYDLAYQRYVFENSVNTNKSKEYYLVVLNHEYITEGIKDGNGEYIFNDDIVKFYNLTSITKKMMDTIDFDTSTVIQRIDTSDAREVNLGRFCDPSNDTKCPFYEVCYKEFPEENSVFIYKNRHHGFTDQDGIKHELYDLINEGKRHALDIPKEYLNRRNNVIQRDVIESGIEYINKDKISKAIEQLKYPIYHLDFESFNAPLPRFQGEKPYQQSVFQFSVHIETTAGVCDKDLDHYEFLAKNHDDIRLELVQSLLNIIKPDKGSVLVYNVSFERSRLKEMQEQFPIYHEQLEDIINRLFDLQHIVETNTTLYKNLGFNEEDAKLFNYYHPKLNGSFSIKKVLPLFSSLTYEGMPVSNGMDAMVAYAKLVEVENQEYEELYNNLVEYCKQDTWALFEILDGLRKKLK